MKNKILLGIAAAAAIASFPYASEAQLQLQQVWALPGGNPDTPFLTRSGNLERGMTYNPVTGNLLITTRADQGGGLGSLNVATVNAFTGAHTGYLNMTTVSGGTFAINLIGIAGDGAIYGANLSVDSRTDPLTIYRWANESSAPTVVYSGDPSNNGAGTQFWGNSFAVRGSGTGTQLILLSTTGEGALLTTNDGNTFNSNLFSVTDGPTTAVGLAFGEGDTFFATRGGNVTTPTSLTRQRPLYEFSLDLLSGTATALNTFGADVLPLGISPIALDLNNGLLAGIATNNDHTVYLYDWNTMTLLDTHAMPGSYATGGALPIGFVSNGNQVGDVVFADGWLWALETNNGLVAFQIIPEPGTYALIFGMGVLALTGIRRRLRKGA